MTTMMILRWVVLVVSTLVMMVVLGFGLWTIQNEVRSGWDRLTVILGVLGLGLIGMIGWVMVDIWVRFLG